MSNSTEAPGPDVGYIIYTMGEIILALSAAIGNGLVIAAIILHRPLQTITNYFVASLAAADFLVGVLGIPCTLVAFNGKPNNYTGCLLMNSMIVILTQISIFGLLAIAVERFIAIKSPYKYTNSCTVTTCMLAIMVVWVMGIAVGSLPQLAWDKSDTYGGECQFTEVIDMNYMVYVNFFTCVLPPLVIILAIYCYIFHVVRQQVSRIAALQTVAGSTKTNNTFANETKAAKWFAVVILLFAFCWLPLHIMNMITLFREETCYPCVLAAILLSHANSAVNPVLYAFANSKFKAAFRKMVRLKPALYEDSLSCSGAKQQQRVENNHPHHNVSMTNQKPES